MRGVIALSILCAGEAFAHPQHADGGAWTAPLLHLLGEPDHLALLLLPVAIALGLWRALTVRSAARRRSLIGRFHRASEGSRH